MAYRSRRRRGYMPRTSFRSRGRRRSGSRRMRGYFISRGGIRL